MFERLNKVSRLLFYLLISIELVTVVGLGFRSHMNISFQNEPFSTLNTGWTYTNDNGRSYQINLPTKLNAGSDKTVSISRTIPTDIDFLSNLSILTSHQNILVFLEDKLIYFRFNEPSDGLFDVPTNNVWDMIPIPPHSEGKLITITISSEYMDYAGKISEIHAGSKTALLLHSIQTSGLGLILAIITFIMGMSMILTYLFLKRLISFGKAILYLGWFTLFCSLWLIMESNLTQLFISNEYVISALTYLSLMTFPVPFLIYITYLNNYHYRKTLTGLTYVFSISALILILLQLFNIYDFHETSFIVRLELSTLLGCVLITLLLEIFKHKNKEIQVFTIASGILFLSGLIEILTYRIRSSNIGVYFQTGFIIFICILSWNSLRKAANMIKLSESAKHYKILATRDLLTNCRNRVCYANDMEKVSLERNITMFVADMNNMKQINDSFGHHAGDEAIILCSQCLLKVFGRRVYRIGGDEFVSIQYDLNPEKTDQLLQEFQAECEKVNEDTPHKFSMSIGYAIFDKDIDMTIYDTVKRADKDMYDRKDKMKGK